MITFRTILEIRAEELGFLAHLKRILQLRVHKLTLVLASLQLLADGRNIYSLGSTWEYYQSNIPLRRRLISSMVQEGKYMFLGSSTLSQDRFEQYLLILICRLLVPQLRPRKALTTKGRLH